MRIQIIDDVITAWGPEVFGENTYDGAPDDYAPDLYDYVPREPGVFDPENFIRKIDES